MLKPNLNNVTLQISAGFVSQFPKDPLPKVAFSGRSNVGKSSLINCLLRRKSLARVSSSPGKTVTIKAKGGASGRLHGKVTGKEVAEALAALAGAPIDKKKIELETKDIKDAGVFNGKVRLYVGVVASFKIQVEVEQA